MEAGSEERIDVRLNEWSFDHESAGFMLEEEGAIIVYLWQRRVIPSILEGDARAAVAERDPIYVFHSDILEAEELDPAIASCFASQEKDGGVRPFGGGIADDDVLKILVRIDPRFREAEKEEWKFA